MPGFYRGFVWVGVMTVFLIGCNEAPPKPVLDADSSHGSVAVSPKTTIRFDEVTGKSGVKFVYRNGEEAGEVAVLESLGGGVALFDLDGDGRLDLCCPGGGHYSEKKTNSQREVLGWPFAIFRNQGDWKFSDVTPHTSSSACTQHYSHGAMAADFDNDGFCDVLITGFGGVLLLHNQGDGTFAEVALPSGLTTSLWSCGAGWGDFNNDGSLDLYVAHYLNWSFEHHPFCAVSPSRPEVREICPPREFDGQPDVLYLSNNDGTFRDASQESGLRTEGKGLGVVVADVDLDGDVDIYVGNDMTANFFYRNQGNGLFEEVGEISGLAFDWLGTPEGSMGVDVGDVDLDGRPDVCSANIAIGSLALYHQEVSGLFANVSREMGITATGSVTAGWGTVFSDFDHDGDEDLFVSNGSVLRYAEEGVPLQQSPFLFENQSGKRLENVARLVGTYFRRGHVGRGCAAGDINNDGHVDLAISQLNQPLVLLSNNTSNSNRWLSLKLIGRQSPRTPIGAIVRVKTLAVTRMLQVKGGSSYASSNDPRLHFGLGTASTATFEINWPSGRTQKVGPLTANQHWVILEGSDPVAETSNSLSPFATLR